tara:strand:+ start:90 stop:557 length:468 start_codon:yes stop_codon:yes gene_type:complete
MNKVTLVKHASGAPGLKYLGLGPSFSPVNGIKKLQHLLNNNTLWAHSRSYKDIRKMLNRSSVVVSIWKGSKLIGFGRATSDGIFRAVLWDIVVDNEYQNSGFGKIIVKALLENPLILKTERVYIMTTNCGEFYTKMGFEIEGSQTLMRLKNYVNK